MAGVRASRADDYPINSSDLARRLLGRQLVQGADYPFVHRVRLLLQEFDCPRGDSPARPSYLVDEEMARRVAEALDHPLR